MAIQKNISVDQGTSFVEDVIIESGPNIPFDLSNHKARLQVRDDYDSTGTRLNLSSDNGKLLIAPESGKVTIKLAPADSTGVKFTGSKLKCVYDLEIESQAGEVIRVTQGTFTFNREVTK